MKKTIRVLASLLVLAAMLVGMPLTALAMDDNPEGNTVESIAADEYMDVNSGTVTTNNGLLETNSGTVETNEEGTVNTNQGTVTTNNSLVGTNSGTVETNGEEGTVVANNGTVTTNDGNVETNGEEGTVTTNNGTVTTNNGTVETNGDGADDGADDSENGTVITNNGIVDTNKGTVETNGEEGIVTNNHGTVTTNNGTVETNGDGDGNGDGVGDSTNGVVKTNNGEIITNNHYVETNGKDGVIDTNNCYVGDFFEYLKAAAGGEDLADFADVTLKSGNFGTIRDNNNTIVCNGKSGFVENNGVITIDDEGNESCTTGLVVANQGTVNNNNASTWYNYGTLNTNKGTVGNNYGTVKINEEMVYENYGTIETNDDTVLSNRTQIVDNNGYVPWNGGTVETNTINGIVGIGTITDEDGNSTSGTVGANYGTVIENNAFYYGVEVKDTDGGLGTKLIQAMEKTIVKLTDLFKRDGYELVGYTQTYQRTEVTESVPSEDPDPIITQITKPLYEIDPITVNSTEYEAAYPNQLTLIWRAIVPPIESPKPAAEPKAEPVKAVAYPTTVQPEAVKAGIVVQVKEQRFKILEAEDGTILVATMGKLSQKDLEDMMAFLAKYFTPEQIAKLLSDPELLSDELVVKFFGGREAHIFFRASADLFAKV